MKSKINNTLHFSWSHIICYVALVFITYISFMGLTYILNGDFIKAILGAFIIDIIILILFIVPQLLKGTESKFERKIKFERILIFSSPLIYIIIMLPFTHFWNMLNNRDSIEEQFRNTIIETKQLFIAYEDYVKQRIDKIKNLRKNNESNIHIANLAEVLKLQLLPENYTTFKSSAIQWIEDASSATVWNVYAISNTRLVESTIDTWINTLISYSEKILSEEDSNTELFLNSNVDSAPIKVNLSGLITIYNNIKFPSFIALIQIIILYPLLLLPYFIQKRNTKNKNRLYHKNSSDSINDYCDNGGFTINNF